MPKPSLKDAILDAGLKVMDIVIRALCLAAAAFGVTWLALILLTLFYNGLTGLNLQVFTENTPPPGSTEGGLLNAIVGSVIMLKSFSPDDRAAMVKDDKVVVTCEFCSSVYQFTPDEAGVEDA